MPFNSSAPGMANAIRRKSSIVIWGYRLGEDASYACRHRSVLVLCAALEYATAVEFLLYGEIVPFLRKLFEFKLEIWIGMPATLPRHSTHGSACTSPSSLGKISGGLRSICATCTRGSCCLCAGGDSSRASDPAAEWVFDQRCSKAGKFSCVIGNPSG